MPCTDFKHCIRQYIIWQDDWNGAVANKLNSVKPVLGDWQSSYRRCSKDEIVLCHAHIGHIHLTHSVYSNILVVCNHFGEKRKNIFGGRDVVESFIFHPALIIFYLNECQFYKF